MTSKARNFKGLKLSAGEIAQRLPHAGNMCLLAEVIEADDKSLTALATSHLNADNPLRLNGKMATVIGIEYAAQAMAVHGSLLTEAVGASPRTGYIATVRNIDLVTPFLPETGSPLRIVVELLMSDSKGFSYQFYIDCQQQRLLSGRITVFLTNLP